MDRGDERGTGQPLQPACSRSPGCVTGTALAEQPPSCSELTLTTATVIAVLRGRKLKLGSPGTRPQPTAGSRQSPDFSPDGSSAKAAILNENGGDGGDGDDGDEPVRLG